MSTTFFRSKMKFTVLGTESPKGAFFTSSFHMHYACLSIWLLSCLTQHRKFKAFLGNFIHQCEEDVRKLLWKCYKLQGTLHNPSHRQTSTLFYSHPSFIRTKREACTLFFTLGRFMKAWSPGVKKSRCATRQELSTPLYKKSADFIPENCIILQLGVENSCRVLHRT